MRLTKLDTFNNVLKSLRFSTCVLVFLPWLLGASGCPNAYSTLADPKSSAAVFYQAKISIDAKDYTGALTMLAALSPAALATRQGHVMRATAYAGRCGLDMVNLAFAISKATGALFPQLLIDYQYIYKSVSQPADCFSAELEMLAVNNLQPAGQMTADDWIFLTFIELAKMGTTLAKVADPNHNGVVDGTFNSCTTISDADTGQVGIGLIVAMNALTASGITLPGTAFNNISALCTQLATQAGDTNLCKATSASSLTANDLLALRAMIKATEVGFGTCGGTTGSNAACSCP